jgi:hypothetical protein
MPSLATAPVLGVTTKMRNHQQHKLDLGGAYLMLFLAVLSTAIYKDICLLNSHIIYLFFFPQRNKSQLVIVWGD